MKNIYVLPTDKPSRLYKDDNQVLTLNTHPVLKGIFTNGIGSNQHIYITNSEEIKEGDWVFNFEYNYIVHDSQKYDDKFWYKKIILTTDQDLINDGVQAIDDDFLEWFVKNPSCEWVGVELKTKQLVRPYDVYNEIVSYYKIIIPQEEPKPIHEQIIDAVGGEDRFKEITGLKSKQETLEEAAEFNFEKQVNNPYSTGTAVYTAYEKGFELGAKWQAERMYSEEDMRKAILTSFLLGVDRGNYSKELEDKLIEIVKKK
jgi:hypothetical protein